MGGSTTLRSVSSPQAAGRLDHITDILFEEFGPTVLHQDVPDVDDDTISQHIAYRQELREVAERIDATFSGDPRPLASVVETEIEELNDLANRAAKPGRDAEELCLTIHGDLLDVIFRLQASLKEAARTATPEDTQHLPDVPPQQEPDNA